MCFNGIKIDLLNDFDIPDDKSLSSDQPLNIKMFMHMERNKMTQFSMIVFNIFYIKKLPFFVCVIEIN